MTLVDTMEHNYSSGLIKRPPTMAKFYAPTKLSTFMAKVPCSDLATFPYQYWDISRPISVKLLILRSCEPVSCQWNRSRGLCRNKHCSARLRWRCHTCSPNCVSL